MRGLFIAAGRPEIPYREEMRDIQRQHTVVSLTDGVTRRLIQDEADRGPFDFVHILDESEIAYNEAGEARLVIRLSESEVLDADALNHILQRAGGSEGPAGLFINSCFGAWFANQAALQGGAPWAVGNTLRLHPDRAWIGPQAFYGALVRTPDPWTAFGAMPADSGYAYFVDLDNALAVSTKPVLQQLAEVLDSTADLRSDLMAFRLERSVHDQEVEGWHERDVTKVVLAIVGLGLAGAAVDLWQHSLISQVRQLLEAVLALGLGP